MGKTLKIPYLAEDWGYSTPCWIWKGGTTKGYGIIGMRNPNKTISAHKYYWEQKNGPMAEGFELDHLCKHTLCVNPDHLEAVTHQENLRRGFRAKKERRRLLNESLLKL